MDVLTLSATPIPRTLYLALTGFRDARLRHDVFQIIYSRIEFDETNEPLFPLFFNSLISTPPPERIPIKTHLSSFRKEKVIEAIKNELDRGGQVFYVLPRIKGRMHYKICLSLRYLLT